MRVARLRLIRNLTVALSVTLLLASGITPALADDDPLRWGKALGKILSHIELHGLSRTRTEVVQRELVLQEGEIVTFEAIRETMRRLKNLQIFSSVRPQFTDTETGVALHLYFAERWTTIPYFKYVQGGGTRYMALGAYDINAFGRFFELGMQYENWQGESGGVFWLYDPRFLNQRLLVGLHLMSVKRPQKLFDDTGTTQASYTLNRQRIQLLAQKEFDTDLSAGLSLTYHDDGLLDTEYQPEVAHYFTDGAREKALLGRIYLELGHLDYDNYLVEGKHSELKLEQNLRSDDEYLSLSRLIWDNEAFWHLPLHANLALRFTVGASDSTSLNQQFYVGGLYNVRGYYDGQFHGRNFWQANAEYRIPSLHNNWLVLQHVFFLDTARVSDRAEQLFSNDPLHYHSAGFGIRVISPKVYKLNLRIDYAVYLSDRGTDRLSIAAQQFF